MLGTISNRQHKNAQYLALNRSQKKTLDYGMMRAETEGLSVALTSVRWKHAFPGTHIFPLQKTKTGPQALLLRLQIHSVE